MAARTLRPKHSDEVRSKIQASQLINRLHGCAMGTVEMSPTQVKSAEILLKKSVPDLSSMELTGSDGGPIEVAGVPDVELDQRIAELEAKLRG